LAKITGTFLINKPYPAQAIVPNMKRLYMPREIEEVSLVFIVFITCGTKDIVVQKAATAPTKSENSPDTCMRTILNKSCHLLIIAFR